LFSLTLVSPVRAMVSPLENGLFAALAMGIAPGKQ
jgi:hypothetical protein